MTNSTNSFFKSFAKNNYFLLITILLSVVAAWLSIDQFKYSTFSDWNSYISISYKYNRGDFKNAINGYWSPLISWIMGLLFTLGFTIEIALKIFFTLCVIINILVINFLVTQLNLNSINKKIIIVSSIPGTIAFASIYKTPDLLSCSFNLLYIACWIIFIEKPNWRNGVIIGIIGALSYYCKYYNFPFFIVHFILFSIFIFIIKKDKQFYFFTSSGVIAFFICATPWILALSLKYDTLTYSTSAKYNTAILSPEWTSINLSVESVAGLIPPPNKTAFSGWEDPTFYPVKEWQPWNSWNDFKFNLKNVARNISIIKYAISYCSIFAFIILLFSFLAIFIYHSSKRNFFLVFISFIIIYPLGYIIIAAEERYFITFYFLLLIAGNILVAKLIKSDYPKILGTVLPLILSLTFILGSVKNYNIYRKYIHENRGYVKAAQIFDKIIPENACFVSNYRELPMYFAMSSNTRFYGIPNFSNNPHTIEEEFKKFNIQYYVNFGKDVPEFFNGKKIIFNDPILFIKVFQLKE